MKYIKKFENNYNNIKNFIVVEYDDDLYFSMIENLRKDFLFIKDLFFFNNEKNETKEESSFTDIHIEFLDGLLFTSDNYDDAYDYFMKKVELKKNSNKYNL